MSIEQDGWEQSKPQLDGQLFDSRQLLADGKSLSENPGRVEAVGIRQGDNDEATLEFANLYAQLATETDNTALLKKVDQGITPADRCFAELDVPKTNFKIDDKTAGAVVDSLLAKLKENYFDPERIAEAEKFLSLQKDKYASIESGEKLAIALTEDLYSVFKDKHLNVFASESVLPENLSKSSKETVEKMLAQQKCENSGIESIEVLDGKIAYINLTGFFPSNKDADPRAIELTKKAIDTAMSSIADKEAMIIDLRENTGGDPATVLKVLDYLLPPGTTVNKIHWREGTSTRVESFETQNPSGPVFGDRKPLYLLTSKNTFSAGEEFAYDLQALGRAKLVGEVTAGGANPSFAFKLTDNFGIAIPTGQSVNPITGKNWEGSGVQPDIKVSSEAALEIARRLILLELNRK